MDGAIVRLMNGLSSLTIEHDFAKAFWGDEMWYAVMGGSGGYEADDFYIEWKKESELEELEDQPDDYDSLPAWEYHLKEMVVLKDPIKYLEQFLAKEEVKE